MLKKVLNRWVTPRYADWPNRIQRDANVEGYQLLDAIVVTIVMGKKAGDCRRVESAGKREGSIFGIEIEVGICALHGGEKGPSPRGFAESKR